MIDDSGRRVLGWFACELPGREVDRWTQPLLESDEEPECILPVSDAGGVLRLGLRLTGGPGWSHREFGPIVVRQDADRSVSHADPFELTRLVSVRQSDEGGRFYRAVASYTVASITDPRDAPEDIVWLTLGETNALAREGRRLSNELRSCLSLLLAGV